MKEQLTRISARLTPESADILRDLPKNERWNLLNFWIMALPLEKFKDTKLKFNNYHLKLSEEAIEKLRKLPKGTRHRILDKIIKAKLSSNERS